MTADAEQAHCINGTLVPGTRYFDVINPATAAPFARCPNASQDDLDRAIAAAAATFQGEWSRDAALRRAVLTRMSEAVMASAQELGRLVCLEQGRPLTQSVAEAFGATQIFSLYANEEVPTDVDVRRP